MPPIDDRPLYAKNVSAVHTKDRFILMVRYGATHWVPSTSYDTLEEAQQAALHPGECVTAWRIVKVEGLPVEVSTREV